MTMVDLNASFYGIRVPGWYPRLCYSARTPPALEMTPVIADVFTDSPSPAQGDDGGVLHEATGFARMLMVAIDSGPDRAVFAGPIYSHYEFYEPGLRRLTDQEWETRLFQKSAPASPEWTDGWLIHSP
jgi:hypothetical protein